jgi:hypothetical protein
LVRLNILSEVEGPVALFISPLLVEEGRVRSFW